jgi:lysophospholipase L1-like esterase
MKRSTRLIRSLAAVAVVGTTMVPGPAQAAPNTKPEPGANYVAIGSSYAAGAGLGPTDPGDLGRWCGRTTISYPNLVADALDLELTNATCGGATTANIATTRQLVRNQNGTHLAHLQMDAVDTDTDLVTITIGGNDVNYVGNLVAEACLGDLAANPASALSMGLKQFGLCAPVPDAAVKSKLADVKDSLVAMLEAVKSKATGARIVLIDYINVLPEDGRPCALMPISQERQKFLLEVARELSLASKRAAQLTGVEFVAASKESRHHDACSSDPWVIGYDYSRGFVMMHPNEAGHVAVADAIIRQVTAAGNAS